MAAYHELLETFTSAPCLMLPDFSRKFYLFCDASDTAVGALLKQKDEINHFRLVGAVSRKFTRWRVA